MMCPETLWTPEAVNGIVNNVFTSIIVVIVVLLVFGNPFLRKRDDSDD
jgi:hypothetical protein